MEPEEKIEIRGPEEFRHIVARCSHERFLRIVRFVCDEFGFTEPTDAVTQIYLDDVSIKRPPHQRRIRDRVAMLGCAVVGLMLLFIFVAGITQIVNWWK